ncbi:MAG TPA: hypothetical protein VNR40_00185, partial [Steroidobacter sp.]|nr:hypothetical protein [Steroidobacter sp.]
MLIIKSNRKRALGLDEPLRHESHKKPVTRRDFLAQGFTTGAATVVVPAAMSMLAPRRASALTGTLETVDRAACNITDGRGKIPFICFDLA